MTRKEYNGWTNYETWVVSLWMGNDCYSQEYFESVANEIAKRCDDKEELVTRLAEAIEEHHQEALPKVDGFAADLLNASMSEVDWREIAAHMVDDMELEPAS